MKRNFEITIDGEPFEVHDFVVYQLEDMILDAISHVDENLYLFNYDLNIRVEFKAEDTE